MGRDVAYMPVCISEKGNFIPACKPFILTLRGEVKPVIPDTNQKQTLILNRKHPAFRYSRDAAELILGGKIQAANRSDFSDAITLHVIEKYGTLPGEILLDMPEENTAIGVTILHRKVSAILQSCIFCKMVRISTHKEKL